MMKRFIGILAAVLVIVMLLASLVLAASLGISPSHTELEVPGDGSAVANFQVHYFSGDIKVSLVDIPLTVEPQTIHIERSSEPVDIELTLYGDESLGSRIYNGYIRFLGMSGGTVAVAIKVTATVTNLVEGETPVLATTEESQPPVPEEPTEESSPAPAPPEEAPPEEAPVAPSEQAPAAPSEQAPAAPPEQAPAAPPEQAPGGEPAETAELNIPLLAGIAAGTIIVMTLIIVKARRPRY